MPFDHAAPAQNGCGDISRVPFGSENPSQSVDNQCS
jgi:hypothetical protein